jgi:hypothetical protein
MKLCQFMQVRRIWLVLALSVVALGGFGCGTTGSDPDNASSKPWNSPEGYQNGNLPSGMFQGR